MKSVISKDFVIDELFIVTAFTYQTQTQRFTKSIIIIIIIMKQCCNDTLAKVCTV